MYEGERFNSISHLVGAALALIGASVLITLAAVDGDALKIVSFSVYGVTLFLLYLSSTLFHSLQGRAKEIFQKLDHFAIYLLIAGTYTPVALVAIQGTTGWWLFGLVWALAALGILLDALPAGRFRARSKRIGPIIIYLLMGWCCLFAIDHIISSMSSAAFSLLLAGGITYTTGTVFFILDNWYAWCHEIWHLFVIAGSVCHYIAILML